MFTLEYNQNKIESDIIKKNKLSNFLIRNSSQENIYFIQKFNSNLKKSKSEKKFKKNNVFDKKDNIKKISIPQLFKNKSKSNDKNRSNNKLLNIENNYCLTDNNYLRGGRINLIISNYKNNKIKTEKNYGNNINLIIKIQSQWRKYIFKKYINKIIIIQKVFRRFHSTKNIKQMKSNIIKIQSIIRRFLQSKKLKKRISKNKIENGFLYLNKKIKKILFQNLFTILKFRQHHFSNNINDSTFNSIEIPEENINLKEKIYYSNGDDNVFGNKINVFQIKKTKFNPYLNESNEVFIDEDLDNNIMNINNDTNEFPDFIIKKINIYNYSNHINYVKNNNKNTNYIKENNKDFDNKKKVKSLFGRKIKKYIESSENSKNKQNVSNDLICDENKSNNILIIPNGLNYEIKRNNSNENNKRNSLIGYIKGNNYNYSKLTSSKLKDYLSKKKFENGNNNINQIKKSE